MIVSIIGLFDSIRNWNCNESDGEGNSMSVEASELFEKNKLNFAVSIFNYLHSDGYMA